MKNGAESLIGGAMGYDVHVMVASDSRRFSRM
jgi:hypothetical protein